MGWFAGSGPAGRRTVSIGSGESQRLIQSRSPSRTQRHATASTQESVSAAWIPLFPKWPARFPAAGCARRTTFGVYRTVVPSSHFPSIAGSIFNFISNSAALLSVATIAIGTLPEYRSVDSTGEIPTHVFETIELVCGGLFSVELVLRVVASAAVPSADELQHMHDEHDDDSCNQCCSGFTTALLRMGYSLIRPVTLIDIAAILPIALSLFIYDRAAILPGADALGAVRILRLARVLRLLKLSHRSTTLQLLLETLKMSGGVILFLLVYLALAGVILSAAVFYFEEGTYQADGPAGPGFYRPNEFGTGIELTPFTSLPASMWYTLATLTTGACGLVCTI